MPNRSLTPRRRELPPSLPIAFGLTMVIALLLSLALPTAASAHPYVAGGGRVPVQSLATIELDLAHGCGDERTDVGRDTDEVALEVPTWLRIVDLPVPNGWTVTIEDATDATLGVIVWSATTGAEPAPRFRLEVVVDGEAGETRLLRVSQRCGELVERWIGSPDAPADQPAVRLQLVAADPSSPPPPEPGPEPEPQAPPTPEVQARPAPGSPVVTVEDVGPRSTSQRGRSVTALLLVAAGLIAAVRFSVLRVRSRRED